MSERRSLRFAPYHLLAGARNVIVDGSATEGTVLTLSHWPQSVVPAGLEADLSAQMALAYLQRWDLHQPAELVSNNHFDQDGLVSVFMVTEPDAALPRQDLLVDIAAAGDFATYRYRDGARVSMTVAAFADPARTPLERPAADYNEWTATLYGELVGRLPELCDHPDRYRHLWAEEDATLEASEEAIRSGAVTIDEVPALDLAVVTVPTHGPNAGGHRFGNKWATGMHPMAVNNATAMFAVLSLRGHSYEFGYRYESWVQYQSRLPRPRRDLRPLAEELTALETSGGNWVFDGAETLMPRLYLQDADESSLSPEEFRRRLETTLITAPPTWNPYPGHDGDERPA